MLVEAKRALEEVGRPLGIVAEGFAELVAPCAWVGGRRLPTGFGHGWPWEISVVCGDGAPELRVLVEAQAEEDDPRAYWDVGERMSAWIEARGGSLARLREVAELFVPDGRAPFRVWHAMSWGTEVRWRIYLSARAGPEPRRRVREAMRRLDRSHAYESIASHEPTIVSLDLHEEGRVKVYTLHREATWPELGALWDDPAAEHFVKRFGEGRWWLVGHTLGERDVTRTALHFGVGRELGDAEAGRRILEVARALGIDPAPYLALRAVQPRHHFVSLQRWSRGLRMTTYAHP